MVRQSSHNPLHLATWMGIGFIAYLLIGCSEAHAGRVCVPCARPVVRAFVAPQVYAAPIYQTPVQYQIGQQLQAQAVDTDGFRQSDEYLELLQLRAFVAGQRDRDAAAGRAQYSPTAEPGVEHAVEPGWTDPAAGNTPVQPLPPGAVEPTPDLLAQHFPTISTYCMTCHGPAPKDNELTMTYDALVTDRALIAKILFKAYNGHMPPTGGLPDEAWGALEDELLADRELPQPAREPLPPALPEPTE